MFPVDVNGTPRHNTRLLPRRNYCSISVVTTGDGTGRKPGPIWEGAHDKRHHKETDYPLLPKSLSVVLNMEADQLDPESHTRPYEIIVPPLILTSGGVGGHASVANLRTQGPIGQVERAASIN
jgi:hypothetical protein